MRQRMKGFTLVEISVALLALGLIVWGAVAFWQQSAGQRVSAVQLDAQQQAHQSVLGFLYARHRLPCPAADANGVESCSLAGGGLRQVGYVPWQTLALPRPEAGRLRYGVFREASATAPLDRDLAVAQDRMNPLRVRTPNPRPQNGNAPNGNAPPLPVASAGLLGATQSGDVAAPLNSACNAANAPPCSLGGAASVNQVDVCLALNTASDAATAPAGSLGVMSAGVRRPAAFAIAAPGLLDADGNGQAFDGANATASDASPTFESSNTRATHAYDDTVLAASHAELFALLGCETGLSVAEHAHFNAATGAFVLERALYDYRDQLYVMVKLAEADVAAATAGVTSAIAGGADAAQAMLSATADTTMSAGARSFQIGLAAVGIAAAVAGGIAAGVSMGLAVDSLVDAQDTHSEFAARTTAITDLSISINRNALLADAIGF
ncbi:type II secretion system protein [Hydrogenophaga taeniospiralis]|nr:prepilin-type N-terminal cleavage/methylation domain-containing protein [Hydrogenophaga taeniospiralis]